MSVSEFLKSYRYKKQVRNYAGHVKKKLNTILDAENDYNLALLDTPENLKEQRNWTIKDCLKVYSGYVGEILINEGKTPDDIGPVKLVKGFGKYIKRISKGICPETKKIKKDIGL